MDQTSLSQIEPLQDATEALRIAWRDLPYEVSRTLSTSAPDLVAAIAYCITTGATAHMPVPELTSDERQPETLPGVGLYDAAIDARPPRKLSDVWEGHGDYNDPLVPEDAHEHELVLRRLREDPEADWQSTAESTPTPFIGLLIGADGVPVNRD